MVNSLPNELLARILLLHSSNLPALSLVSSLWRAIAKPTIFHHLHVRTVSQLVDVGNVFGPEPGALISTKNITFSIQTSQDVPEDQRTAMHEACVCLASLLSNNDLQWLSFIGHTAPTQLPPAFIMAFNSLSIKDSPIPLCLLDHRPGKLWQELVVSSIRLPDELRDDAPMHELLPVIRSKKVWAESFLDFVQDAEERGHGHWARALLQAERCLTVVEHNIEQEQPSEEDSLHELVPEGVTLRHLSLVTVCCLGGDDSRVVWNGFKFASFPFLESLTLIVRDSDIGPLQVAVREGLPSTLLSIALEVHASSAMVHEVEALLSLLAVLTNATIETRICHCYCFSADDMNVNEVRGEMVMSEEALDLLDLMEEDWEEELEGLGNVAFVLPTDTIQGLLHLENSPNNHQRMGCLCCLDR